MVNRERKRAKEREEMITIDVSQTQIEEHKNEVHEGKVGGN